MVDLLVMEQVLDHGYLHCTQSWGSDETIIESARMSTDGGFVSWDPYEDHPKGDLGLLRYLWKNKHFTPFEMCGLTVEVKAPIFVLRQWHRHRTQSYNEMSARYVPLPSENYTPGLFRCIPLKSGNTQARGSTERCPTEDEAQAWQRSVETLYRQSEAVYQMGLRLGVPKEVARVVIPVARYSTMRASANLRNWLAFQSLRLDPHAQHEIRVYAEALDAVVKEKFPRTWALFHEKDA